MVPEHTRRTTMAADQQQWCYWLFRNMMTSSNGNIFRVTGPLCGDFTGPGEIPTQRPVTWSFDLPLICVWINGWVNNREASDLRRHRGHHDVTVRACGGGHGSARPVITLVLTLLTPVLFVPFILFYFYILYRCKLFLLPWGWILLGVLMVWFSVLYLSAMTK